MTTPLQPHAKAVYGAYSGAYFLLPRPLPLVSPIHYKNVPEEFG